jgi:hypothetical protein
LSALQFAGSSFGLTLFWSTAVGGFALAVFSLLSSAPQDAANLLLVAAAALWAGLLLLPSAAYSLAALLQRSVRRLQLPATLGRLLPLAIPVLLGTAILLGSLAQQGQLALLLSPLHIAAATLSVAWFVWLGLRRLQLGSAQLGWGSLASGLVAAPFIAIFFEFAGGLLLVAIALVYVATNPALSREMLHIQSMLPVVENDPERLLNLLDAFINDPIILSLMVTNFSLFVPLIEELAKPVAVWLLVWRGKLSNAQGFGIGLLGGAGFALMENLFSGAQTLDWTGTAVVRIGATAFHIATAGLMGWAIVRAKNEGRYLAVFVVYAVNILLHGLWNGVIILQSFSPSGASADFSTAGALILLAVAGISVGILAYMNRKLQPAPAATPAAAPVRRRAAAKRSRTK